MRAVSKGRVLVGGRDLCGTFAGARYSEAWTLYHPELVGFASDELTEQLSE